MQQTNLPICAWENDKREVVDVDAAYMGSCNPFYQET